MWIIRVLVLLARRLLTSLGINPILCRLFLISKLVGSCGKHLVDEVDTIAFQSRVGLPDISYPHVVSTRGRVLYLPYRFFYFIEAAYCVQSLRCSLERGVISPAWCVLHVRRVESFGSNLSLWQDIPEKWSLNCTPVMGVPSTCLLYLVLSTLSRLYIEPLSLLFAASGILGASRPTSRVPKT